MADLSEPAEVGHVFRFFGLRASGETHAEVKRKNVDRLAALSKEERELVDDHVRHSVQRLHVQHGVRHQWMEKHL